MCGFGGFYGRFAPDLLGRMNSLMTHRGPNDEGVFQTADGLVGLAHRRLSILDLSPLGHQPMAAADGQVQIAYNGEIYNFRELRTELEAKGCRFRSHSDTEVLLALYLDQGADMLARLNGIFAFALWDARRGEMLIARDQLGVKPVYLAQTEHGLVFASEIRAVLAEPSVPRAIDRDALTRQLTYLWTPGRDTILSGVKRIEPGCAVWVKDGRIAKSFRYFDLPTGQADSAMSPEAASDMVLKGVREAVHRQMVADVPVGAFLSGGLDSSSVAAFAREVAKDGVLQCYTIASEPGATSGEGFAPDLPYARKVAAHLGLPLEEVPVSADDVLKFDAFLGQADSPIVDPAALNTFLICQAARDRGFRVLLSGAGGDDVFTGYRRHVALAAERLWAWAPQPARAGLSAIAGALPARPAMLRRLKKMFENAHLSAEDRLIAYFFWLAPERARKLTGASDDVRAPLAAALARFPQERDPLERMLALEKLFFLADHNLDYTDKMGMAASIEVRVPLIDMEVIAMAAKIPSAIKQTGNVGKAVFKRAMEGILPQEVIYRPKTGFGAPLRDWMNGALKAQMAEHLTKDRIAAGGMFDPEEAARLIEDDRAGRVDAAYIIFSLYAIQRWAEGLNQSAR